MSSEIRSRFLRRHLTLLAVGLAVAAPLPAFAYLDPGSGSILIQSLLAGVTMAVGGVTVFFNRIRDFFSKFRRKKEKTPDR